MKTLKYLPLLVFCCSFIQVSAQFSIGLKGGHTKAWEDYGDTWLPEDARVHVNGINLSGLAYYKLGKHFQIGLEPGFIQRGAACEPGFLIFNSDTKLFLNYLELPVMFAYNSSIVPNKLDVFAKVGFSTSMMIKASREVRDMSGLEPTTTTSINLDDSTMKRWDSGLHGNIGLAYNLGRNQLFVEAAYYHGLRDVDSFFTSKNRSINLGLGYIIKL